MGSLGQFSFLDWALLVSVVVINLGTTWVYVMTSLDLRRAHKERMATEQAVRYSIENRRAPVPLTVRKSTGIRIVPR